MVLNRVPGSPDRGGPAGSRPAGPSPQLTPAAPARVVFADVEDGCPDLATLDGPRYAWVVIRSNGRPRTLVEVDRFAPAQRFAAAWARVVAEPEEPLVPVGDAELPTMSVVVPTLVSRVGELGRCLDSLAAAGYPRADVVLVDNRRHIPAGDPLPGLLAGRPWVRVLREERPGISAARNAGVHASRGEVVAFTDDDVVVDPGWLRAIGSRFVREPGLDLVTGLILPAEIETAPQLWFERYYGGFAGERSFATLSFRTRRPGGGLRGRTEVIARDAAGREHHRLAIYGAGACGAGANMAFRREALCAMGGFDVALGVGTAARGGEDLAAIVGVLWRGGSVGYEPGAVVSHRHRVTYPELRAQMVAYGLGFTAMLTALVAEDRGHAAGLAVQLPAAMRRLASATLHRAAGRWPPARLAPGVEGDAACLEGRAFPRELSRLELWGYLRGPLAYGGSRRANASWHPPTG